MALDLVLFGMIAAFLVLRLRSILGKREGFERGASPVAVPERPRPVIDAQAVPVTSRGSPDTQSTAGQVLIRIAQADPGFSTEKFIGGAERAFPIIVGAFARGETATLRPLLTDAMYDAFDEAIRARVRAGETQKTEIRALHEARITDAALADGIASITVRFVSDQVSLTTTSTGAVVAGTDAMTEIADAWTFERRVGDPDPAWRLAQARA